MKIVDKARVTSAHVNNDNEACQTTDWSNATANCKQAYTTESNRLLGGVCIPDALLCKHVNCTNPDYIAAIDDFYQSINRSLIASSADTIRSRHYNIQEHIKNVTTVECFKTMFLKHVSKEVYECEHFKIDMPA